MAVLLLAGASLEESLVPLKTADPAEDPLSSFTESAAAQIAAFAEPGSTERVCHHAMGDIPGAQVLAFRIGDLTLHAWDLARATGGNEELEGELVAQLWSDLSPLAQVIPHIGMFGAGPSGTVLEDAPLQARLLDLVGRRP
jgi:uncharacterized protein (TIGR03086 family)